MNTAAPNSFAMLSAAVLRLLGPLVRVLLRNGMSFNAFSDLAKRVYVETAMRDFGIPGKKQTISRVSVLTGLSRKEVQRVLSNVTNSDVNEAGEQYNRAARVIAGWIRDQDFVDDQGNPLPLAAEGDGASFAALVKRHSGDMPARAVLDELLRVGAAVRRDDGRIDLVARAYIPRASEIDKLDILGNDVADLITTIDHNLQRNDVDLRFQRKVMYDNVPEEALGEFRSLSAEKAQALLEAMDQWLSQHDRDANPARTGSGRVRTGIGIYYFAEAVEHRSQAH